MQHDTYFCSLNPAVSLHWVSWDDEYVVFDETSGQTHQMDALRGFVLNSLDFKKVPLAVLVSDILSSLNLSVDTDQPVIDSILREFESHGLVEFSLT